MSSRLHPADIERIVAETVARLRGSVPLEPTSAEITTAQAIAYTNHASRSSFYDWARARRIRPISRGRWRRAALDRALGK